MCYLHSLPGTSHLPTSCGWRTDFPGLSGSAKECKPTSSEQFSGSLTKQTGGVGKHLLFRWEIGCSNPLRISGFICLPKNLPQNISAHTAYSPKKILSHINSSSLLSSIFMVIPYFSWSLLRPRQAQDADSVPAASVEMGGTQAYRMRSLLDPNHQQLQYLVNWKGYGLEKQSWIPARDMLSQELVDKFHHVLSPLSPAPFVCYHLYNQLDPHPCVRSAMCTPHCLCVLLNVKCSFFVS